MKKFIHFLLFTCIFTIAYSTSAFAENEILIKTVDTSKVIKAFVESFPENGYMLAKNGFGENSVVGTPFSVECQTYNGNNDYLFYFPIINNGKIITYVEVNRFDDENKRTSWAVAKFYDGESCLEQLSDGNIYALISDKNTHSDLAISDNKVVVLKPLLSCDMSEYDYSTPYEGKETKVVNIMKPIDIDTYSVTPQTEEERAIIEDARENGKTLVLQNADVMGAIIKDDRLLVPLRNIAEAIDCTVEWDGNEKAAYANKDSNSVKFVIGSTEYSVNGKAYSFDVPAEIYNDRTYIPLRAVGEALGADVTYNPANKNIYLSY